MNESRNEIIIHSLPLKLKIRPLKQAGGPNW